ncbi:MAG TPA: hypothetical protein PKX08_18170 [Cyclobacteriaceae bacterium]|nr:hypothetical protein [Cyclobacteriaceae bacterium]
MSKNTISYPRNETNQLIALIDLDGTLCDYQEMMSKRLLELREPSDNPEDELVEPPPQYILNRRQKIMTSPGFWISLRPIFAGIQLANLLTELKFDTYVLTKGPKNNPTAWSEKFEWCRIHVPHLKVIVSENKSLVYGDVLVDDWLPYVTQWQQRFVNGFVIIPRQPWNTKSHTLRNSIHYDGNNLKEIKEHLQSVKKSVQGDF